MEYQVPQFIEVEDKIVGPLTLRQFIYLAGGAGLCVILFIYLPFIFAAILALPVAGFVVALSFYRVNGKAFIEILEAGFNYYVGGKLFLWKHENPKVTEKAPVVKAEEQNPSQSTPRLTRGKLSDLAWSLDVRSKQGGENQS